MLCATFLLYVAPRVGRVGSSTTIARRYYCLFILHILRPSYSPILVD